MEITKRLKNNKKAKKKKKRLTKPIKPIKIKKKQKSCYNCIHWKQYLCGKFDFEPTAAQEQKGCKKDYKKNKHLYF